MLAHDNVYTYLPQGDSDGVGDGESELQKI